MPERCDRSAIREQVFRCVATGDSMVTRRLPEGAGYAGFSAVRDFITQADFRFGNLETTVHNYESCSGARSGGSWLCSPPGVLADLRRFGLNILSTANNHAMDYSYGGLLRTIHYLRESDFPFSGTGENLAAASAPAYLDTVGGRYALISCTATFHPEAMAGEQTRDLPGRPGVNGVGVVTKYRLPPEELAHIRRIAGALRLNARDEIRRREGYLPPQAEGRESFGPLNFEAGVRAEVVSGPGENDMRRIEAAIREARFMADYVVVSFHCHEISGDRKEAVDPVSIAFSRRCIDVGADAVVGTGVHLLRPMEIYRNRPIFYCLGDFIIQLETILRAPAEMFAGQGLGSEAGLSGLFEARSDHGRRGLCYDRVMFESVVPYWEADGNGLRKLEFLPVEEHFSLPRSCGGWPRKCTDRGIMERFAEMCRPFGVEIDVVDGMGVTRL